MASIRKFVNRVCLMSSPVVQTCLAALGWDGRNDWIVIEGVFPVGVRRDFFEDRACLGVESVQNAARHPQGVPWMQGAMLALDLDVQHSVKDMERLVLPL